MQDKPIKVLHLVAGDIGSGAARGAYWLHLGLRRAGVDSKVLTTSRRTLGDENIISITGTSLKRAIAACRWFFDLVTALVYPRRKHLIFSSGFLGPDLTGIAEFREADIIHLHWVNSGFFNIRYFGKIKQPIVWTLRDMWPMTGGCHYADFSFCDRYQDRCGQCKQLGSRSDFDLSRIIWNRKKKFYRKDIKYVGISDWIADKARESGLLKGLDIRTIHNNIDVEQFSPVDKVEAKRSLGLGTDKKLILVGATALNIPFKGLNLFIEALNSLDKDKYLLGFFGKGREGRFNSLGYEIKYFGQVSDNAMLSCIYSAADVFVSPSMIEAFGKTIAEAMACGTPSVCFDVSGQKEIVDHQLNGYKAVAFDPVDLARGIEWVVQAEDYAGLCRSAREKVTREFTSQVAAGRYLDLYRELTGRSTQGSDQ